ncbi:hypothetical protein LY76DRAFT_371987 [Colletotrichum caudatum]|nr:hypothetical protein LY76DRAFT_371987 [Colletotrichum caudatum]
MSCPGVLTRRQPKRQSIQPRAYVRSKEQWPRYAYKAGPLDCVLPFRMVAFRHWLCICSARRCLPFFFSFGSFFSSSLRLSVFLGLRPGLGLLPAVRSPRAAKAARYATRRATHGQVRKNRCKVLIM